MAQFIEIFSSCIESIISYKLLLNWFLVFNSLSLHTSSLLLGVYYFRCLGPIVTAILIRIRCSTTHLLRKGIRLYTRSALYVIDFSNSMPVDHSCPYIRTSPFTGLYKVSKEDDFVTLSDSSVVISVGAYMRRS